MSLTLQLFGAPALRDESHLIPLRRRKAMALLAYLAVTGTRHHRDVIEALLWPESSEAAASQALRNVLWTIRQTSLAELLQGDRASVALDTTSISVDVLRFRQLLSNCPGTSHGMSDVCDQCEPQLREAADLYQDSFMSGFSVRNTARFEGWLFAEAEAFRRELAELLDRLTEYYLLNSEWRLASQYARKWIQSDRLNERAYRRLMKGLAAQDKRIEVFQTFRECAAILDTELGLAPDGATRELAESIRTTSAAVPLLDREVRASRLPHVPAPIIGRQEIAAEVENLLLDDSARVVTLVGLGGAGKTSLALHVAQNIAERFCDGATWVPLDSRSGATAVVSAVANALSVTLAPKKRSALEDEVGDLLRNRSMLLIIDGAESLLPYVASLLRALDVASEVRILVTSRIEVGVIGEHTIVLQGLEYPDEDAPADVLRDSSSIRLLRLASRRKGITLRYDEAELRSMARLSRLLEGSPLALEMASAWRSILSWDQIADRVFSNLEFLRHPQVDVSSKQSSFIAVFEQSWLLLPREAQEMLRRLSVFRGGFTIRAAEFVTESSPASLALLVNRCLLKRVGPDRFEMHGLLRQFATRKLREDEQEFKQMLERHTEFFLSDVSRWFAEFSGPKQHHALAGMGAEMANVVAAFEQAADEGLSEQLQVACEGLFFYYDILAKFERGEAVFVNAARAYREHGERDVAVEAFLEIAAGWFMAQTDTGLGVTRLSEGLKLLRGRTPTDRFHAMLYVICAYASPQNHPSEHIGRLQRSIDVYHALGDRWGEGLALGAWANIETKRDAAHAEELAQRSLFLHRKCGDQWGEGLAICTLGVLAESQGHLELAYVRYQESCRLVGLFDLGRVTVINLMIAQSRVSRALGHVERSWRIAKDALELSRNVGYRLQTANALLEMADANRERGDLLSAKTQLEEAFAMLSQRNCRQLQTRCALALCEIALSQQESGTLERWLREAAVLEPENTELLRLMEKLGELRGHEQGVSEIAPRG